MDLIPLFPVRTVKKDPTADSPVLFTACAIMGVLQRSKTLATAEGAAPNLHKGLGKNFDSSRLWGPDHQLIQGNIK